MKIVKPGAQMMGPEVREFRRDLNWNQERFAILLAVSKAYLQKIESAPGPAPSFIAERIFGVKQSRLIFDELKDRASQQPRRFHDFRRSSKFKTQPPPFNRLPACACADLSCNLTPVAAGKWSGGALWWKFQGIRCRRISYLDQRGKIVTPPPRYVGDSAPSTKCVQCGRMRTLGKKFSFRLGCEVYTRYCRRQKGDSKDQQHDPPACFVLSGTQFVPLSKSQLTKLHGRSDRVFDAPTCAVTKKRMEHSGTRLGEVAAFRCRGGKAHAVHYEFRHIPDGAVVSKMADGWYRWTNGSGEQKELHAKPGGNFERRPHRHAAPPKIACPDHPKFELLRRSGPWTDPRTRKLRWQYSPCPSDPTGHPGWTCSHGEAPRIVRSRSKRRWEGQHRRLTTVRRRWGRNQYRLVLPEFQVVRKFAMDLSKASLQEKRKIEHIEEFRLSQNFKQLGNYWPDFLNLPGVRVAYPKTWTPSGVAETLIARRLDVTEETFRRKILQKSQI